MCHVRERSGHRPDCSEIGNRQRLTPQSQRPVAARSQFVESRDPTNSTVVCGETPSESENHRWYSRHPCRRLETVIEALQKFLRRAAEAAARSVHAVRLGSPVGAIRRRESAMWRSRR